MTALTSLNRRQSDSIRVWHWYDFGCPYCYVAQDRLAILRDRGIHPDILPYPMPTGARPAGRFDPPRGRSTHRLIERAARAAGLALHWPTHVPNTRRGLAAAEWVRQYQPDLFESFYRQLFAAHFALGQDVGDPCLIDDIAERIGVDVVSVRAALSDGTAEHAVAESVSIAKRYGVTGLPAWLIGQRVVTGLSSRAAFDDAVSGLRSTSSPGGSTALRRAIR